MQNKFSFISAVSLPLGSIGLNDALGGASFFLDLVLAMPKVHVFYYALRTSTATGHIDKLPVLSALPIHRLGIVPSKTKFHIGFTSASLYSCSPVGQQFDMAREFGDIFQLQFFQWPAGMHSNRSEVFKAGFKNIYEQTTAIISALEGLSLCPDTASSSLRK